MEVGLWKHASILKRFGGKLTVEIIKKAPRGTLIAQDRDGLIPLHSAVDLEMFEVFRDLLERAAQVFGHVIPYNISLH